MGKTINQLNPGDTNVTPESLLVVWNNGSTEKASISNVSSQTSFLKYTNSTSSRCRVIQNSGPDLDPALTLDMDEIGRGFFQVTCRAVFTGSPPVAFINEPAAGLNYGTSTVRRLELVPLPEGRPTFTGVSLLAGYVVVGEEITSLIYPHTNFSDYIEPMFFYGNEPDCESKYGPGWTTSPETCLCVPPADWSSSSSVPPPQNQDTSWGYMVEISVILDVSESWEPVGLRWCSSDGYPTTMIGGQIVAHKLNPL